MVLQITKGKAFIVRFILFPTSFFIKCTIDNFYCNTIIFF
jgi:hypothetical protein